MSTERPTFGLNSILPSTYRNKAEAFAKCLQDKLRSLSGLDDPAIATNGRGLLDETPATPHGSLSKYSEEEITDSIFLQGPLAYKRKSIPERTGPPPTNGRYISSVADRRGCSSDSEDSDNDEFSPVVDNVVHRRIAQLQSGQHRDSNRRLTSDDSVDSTTSWCSCEEPDDDDEEVIDSFASQIKGSPTIHNPRSRNFKRKPNKVVKEETPSSAPAENDLFFDFDVECFSPANLDDGEGDDNGGFHASHFKFISNDLDEYENECKHVMDTGQQEDVGDIECNEHALSFTPQPSSSNDMCRDEGYGTTTKSSVINDSNDDRLSVHEWDRHSGCEINEHWDQEEEEIPDGNEVLIENHLRDEKYGYLDEGIIVNSFSENVHSEDIQNILNGHEKHETESDEKDVPYEIDDSRVDEEFDRCFLNNLIIENDKGEINTESVEAITFDDVDLAVEIDDLADRSDSLKSTTEHVSITVAVTPPLENETKEQERAADGVVESRDIKTNLEVNLEFDEIIVKEEKESLNIDAEKLNVEDVEMCGATSIVITKCDDDKTNDVISPRMKLRRCSSLKTWKTPPGTPGRKKIVRFADALGLDLADIRTFLDELPKIPKSAYEDLNFEPPPVTVVPPRVERTLIPMFQQPGTQMDFVQRVRQNNVLLESAILSDVSLLAISGMVRVRNLSFHKSVHIRYSKDAWATFADLQATFIPGSSDGFCDNFSFTLYGHTLNIGDRLEFAIRYECGAGQFWDSNSGLNYVFQCMPRSPMPLFPPLGSSPVDSWTKFY